MPTLTITIAEVTEPDFDGVNETVKSARASIDGVDTNRAFAYPAATSNAAIDTDVRAKLSAEGYVFV